MFTPLKNRTNTKSIDGIVSKNTSLIPLDLISSEYGFKYGHLTAESAEGYHPFVEILEKHLKKECISPESLRFPLVTTTSPETLHRRLFPLYSSYSIKRLFPISSFRYHPDRLRKWIREQKIPQSNYLNIGKGSINKLINLSRSIHSNGYIEDGAPPIRLVPVSCNGNLRYWVKGGQHRLAVLTALGYQEAPCVITNSHNTYIDMNFLEHTRIVEDGVFSAKEMRDVFGLIFRNPWQTI